MRIPASQSGSCGKGHGFEGNPDPAWARVENTGIHGVEPVAAIHTPAYLHFLENIYRRWQQIEGASEEVIANVHPNRYSSAYPDSAVGQADWHMADTICPLDLKM